MPLNTRTIATRGKSTYVIAEMAWSHNGNLQTAIQIARGAKNAGADAIGIHLTSLPDYMVADYKCTAGQTISGSQPAGNAEIYGYLERLNLKWDEWLSFFEVAAEIDIDVCAMCNDIESLKFAKEQRVSSFALAAACFTEYDFVRELAQQNKPMVLRIGGATLGEIERVIDIIRGSGNDNIILLHGIQLYPTEVKHMNLSRLGVLKEAFGVQVGLADHIDGGLVEAQVLPLLGLPYGISVIEKHITLDRSLAHEDFEAALGITEFHSFMRILRTAELAIGEASIGALTPAELKYRRVSRKKTVARRPLSQGTVISESDLAFKRSDFGLDAGEASVLIGRTLNCDIQLDDGLDLNKIV
jgi:sialic acid synthase SpsE